MFGVAVVDPDPMPDNFQCKLTVAPRARIEQFLDLLEDVGLQDPAATPRVPGAASIYRDHLHEKHAASLRAKVPRLRGKGARGIPVRTSRTCAGQVVAGKLMPGRPQSGGCAEWACGDVEVVRRRGGAARAESREARTDARVCTFSDPK